MANYQYMMSAEDVAKELNCSKSHAYKLIKSMNVYSDHIEHTARRFSAQLPPIQCTPFGHQSIVITLEYLYHSLLAMTQATLLDPADN